MYKKTFEAYQAIEKTTSSGRETEARVLNKGAQKLIVCQNNWDSNDLQTRLKNALEFNQKIWSIFQAELTKKDNPMPKEIKDNLLRLSIFIDKRIFETMAFPNKNKLTIIININKNIAAGLMDSLKRQATPNHKLTGIKQHSRTYENSHIFNKQQQAI